MKAVLDIAIGTTVAVAVAVIGVLTHHHKVLLGTELVLWVLCLAWAGLKKAKTSLPVRPVRPDEEDAT